MFSAEAPQVRRAYLKTSSSATSNLVPPEWQIAVVTLHRLNVRHLRLLGKILNGAEQLHVESQVKPCKRKKQRQKTSMKWSKSTNVKEKKQRQTDVCYTHTWQHGSVTFKTLERFFKTLYIHRFLPIVSTICASCLQVEAKTTQAQSLKSHLFRFCIRFHINACFYQEGLPADPSCCLQPRVDLCCKRQFPGVIVSDFDSIIRSSRDDLFRSKVQLSSCLAVFLYNTFPYSHFLFWPACKAGSSFSEEYTGLFFTD